MANKVMNPNYCRHCNDAKAELQTMLNDLNSRQHTKGNLSYLIKRAMSDIDNIESYLRNFGEEENLILHVGYTLEQMGYEK